MAASRRQVVFGAVAAPLSTGGFPALAAGARHDDSMLSLGARDAVTHIRDGDIGAEAYMACLLRQYHACRDLNAIISIDEGRILDAARGVDRARARGETLGPAAGLPFGVKDQIDAAGYATTGGNGNLKGNVPRTSAPVVEALCQAGGIVFAKTMMPDMVAGYDSATAVASQNPYFGTPHNPYNPAHLVGGTSGGNAVALAAHFVPAAIGEDTTGSIRFPAAMCGVAGLRPSTYTIENALNGSNRKRYSDAGMVVPQAGPQDTWGPMARSVADVAFLDSLITGETAPQVDLRQAGIAIPARAYWDQDFVDPGLAEVCLASFAKLRAAGTRLVEIDFDAVRDLSESADFQRALWRPRHRDLGKWLAANLPGMTLEQIYARRRDQPHPPGPEKPPPTMPAEERRRILTATKASYAEVFRSNGVTAIAFPTSCIPAQPLRRGYESMGSKVMIRGKAIDQNQTYARNVFWDPRLGGPGLNIPVGLTRGLPVGLELTGLPGQDTAILGLGMAVERVVGRLPPPPLAQRS